jgi:isoaspartyl peptidase/L-asparaginase-like protein (Ntn-hydrolase superfamily)
MLSSANGLIALETGWRCSRRARQARGWTRLSKPSPSSKPIRTTTASATAGCRTRTARSSWIARSWTAPSYGAGAVAAIKNIKYPSRVARLVMERTSRILIVGDGARRFALAHGFKEENLLTEASREKWLRWKEQMSDIDDWGPPKKDEVPAYAAPPKKSSSLSQEQMWRSLGIDPDKAWGTINCLALDANGDFSGITTTSGLAFKIPGRVGDSPLIGCGLYVDNEVGAAGSTGVGEECIKIVGAHTVVEFMRQGMHPREAAFAAIKRVLSKHGPRVTWNLNFYADEQGRRARRRRDPEGQPVRRARRHDGELVDSAAVIERPTA